MARKKVSNETLAIEIAEIRMAEARFNIMGVSPLIMHRFSQKAWQELTLPKIRSNRAGLQQTLKHDLLAEYRGAFYRNRDPKAPTFFHVPNGAFHAAISDVALDLAGPKKAQMERLTQITDVNIHLYGVPEMYCAMVRNSDQNRTPDVRTRPIFPQWGCTITVQFLQGALTERSIAHLVSAAGLLRGVGDWRPQKGGPFGRYKLVRDNDSEFRSLMKTQARKSQMAAYEKPAYFDADTEELAVWFSEEVRRREMEGQLQGDEAALPDVAIHRERGNGGQYEGIESE